MKKTEAKNVTSKHVDLRLKFLRPKVESVATHYLRTPAFRIACGLQ